MRFQTISDIHIDINRVKNVAIPFIVEPKAPTLCVLGDLGNPFSDEYKQWYLYHTDLFEDIVFIAGNHEYYNKYGMTATETRLTDIASLSPKLHYLNRSTVTIDGITIAGTVLWSHIPKQSEIYCNLISDYRKIIVDNSKFTAENSNALHQLDREWLKKQTDAQIIMTHHVPSWKLLDPEFEGSTTNPFFMSHSDDLFTSNIKYWLYGHVHRSNNVVINDINFICNPRGVILNKIDINYSGWNTMVYNFQLSLL